MKNILALTILFAVLLFSCNNDNIPSRLPAGTSVIQPSPQRAGYAIAGYEYLIYGDYVSTGIPLDVYNLTLGNNSEHDLGRTGDNAGIPFNYTAVTAASGAKVVTPNCLNCHAEMLNGELVIGLGNNTSDYTSEQGELFNILDPVVQLTYGENSPEWQAYYPASRSAKTISPYIITKTQGVNPADKIFAALSAHRHPTDLTWIDDPQHDVPNEVIPTDVPAWWLLKKKNALYYNALGVGDFGRLSAASGLLTMKDSAEARAIDDHFADVMAFIRSIEPPDYPYSVDETLAKEGEELFINNCSECHGTYGSNPSYPNLLVKLSTIKTDPALANVYQAYPEYHTWYNDSWFAKAPGEAALQPTDGYIAPPLDGIWATAPYLHNGSVPTLEELLNSPARPTYWRRSFDNSDYDRENLGWKHEKLDNKEDDQTYDTSILGYGNGGHPFGDSFTGEERKAVLEYLKTL